MPTKEEGQYKKMIFETSWDDMTQGDLEIARLLKSYTLPGIFYVPIDRELDWHKVKEIGKDFEIGSHTITHPADIKLLDDEHLDLEIDKSKKMLEAVFDRPITSFCYPRGRFDDRVIERVKEAGYKEARTTEVLRTDNNWDPFKKPTTIHVFDRKEYVGDSWSLWAYRLFDEVLAEDGYFHLWGHAWEVNKYGEWEALEAFFKYVSKKLKR